MTFSFFSPDEESHVKIVREVLKRLLKHELFVKAEKCEFHQAQVSFLGYVISKNHIEMDRKKVKAVIQWPTPSSRKEVLRVLGFSNFYRKFIRNFNAMAAP